MNANLSFGPVIELTLNLPGKGITDCLDLDSGNVVSQPDMNTYRDSQGNFLVAPQEQLTTNGIAIIVPVLQWPIRVISRGTLVSPCPQQNNIKAWNEMTARELVNSPAVAGVEVNDAPAIAVGFWQSPNTFIFKTRTGNVGLLQITGFTNNYPRQGVKIRYKLVQPIQSGGNVSAPLKPIPPEAAIMWAAVKADTKSFSEKYDGKDTNLLIQFSKEMAAHQKAITNLLQGTIAEPLLKAQAERMKTMTQMAKQNGGHIDHDLLAQQDAAGQQLEAMIMAASPAAAQSLSFGPVKELWLPIRADIYWTPLLDLETGTLTKLPESPDPLHPGLAINYSAEDDIAGPSGNGVVIQNSVPSQWNEITDLEAVARLRAQPPGNPGTMSGPSTQRAHTFLPLTYLFKSATGRIGLLQIIGFTDNPRGVKIRYKLVQPAGPKPNASALQFRLVLPEDSTAASDPLPDVSGQGQLRVSRTVLLDASAVAQAGADFNPDGTRKIEIQFTVAGRQRFAQITATNLSHQLAVVFRGKVLCAPFINSTISDGQCQIDGNMSREEVYALLDSLNRTTTASDQTWKFTAPRERSLPFQRSPEFLVGWLDLDSGTVLTNSMLDWQSHAGHEWIRTNGLDVVATESSNNLPALLGVDLVLAPAPTNGWDIVTATDVGQNWTLMQQEPRQEQIFGAPPGQSGTFFFQTREGGKGILQITDFTDNPPGVKLRYKLAQNGGGKN